MIIFYGKISSESIQDNTLNISEIYEKVKNISEITIYFSFIMIFFHIIIFRSLIIHLNWIIVGSIIFLIFILSLLYLIKSHLGIKENLFVKKFFWMSLLFRFSSILILYLIGFYFTGTEFEVGASDSKKYHIIASSLVDYFKSGNNKILLLPIELDDYGFIIFNSLIYSIFNSSTIVIRIMNAFFGAFTVVYIYKYLKLIIEDIYARIASIIAMLFPIFLYFTGVHMKETFLLFCMILCLYYATLIFYSGRLSTKNLISLSLSIILLFLMRFSLAISSLFAIFLTFLFAKKNIKNVLLFSIAGIFVIFILNGLGLIDNLFRVLSRTGLYSSEQLAKSGSVSNVGTLFFIISGFIGPFPGLVNIPAPTHKIHSTTLYQLGGLFSLIFLKSFFIIGVLSIIKNKIKVFYPILGFYFINLLGLALSATALDIRYQMPNNILIIVISVLGIKSIRNKNKYIILPYYILVIVGTLFWNYLRLSGRGLI
jgi:hypothetical protein